MNVNTKLLVDEYVGHCNGFEKHYRHWMGRYSYSEGVKFVADTCECRWLIDAIISHQNPKMIKACDGFQCWTLKKKDKGAVLTGGDGNRVLVTQNIEFTNFPIDEIEFYIENTIIMLPEER